MAQQELKRGLSNRHVQLIAIGGTIGTGLFLGSGKAIQLAGPSIIFAYLIVGIAIFFVMRALGELLLSKAGYQSLTDIAEDYLGPRVAFVTGWTYWFCWIMTAMGDVIAVGVYVQYWFHIPQWIPALVCLMILLGLNLLTVKLFGELEFWFALIKVITILVLIVIGIILLVMGFKTAQGMVTLKNIWEHGGLFPNGISGFLLSFQMVVFSFVGVELVGVSAAETSNPEKNIPSAINKIPLRILFFYVGALIVLLCINPWTELNAAESPFVKTFSLVGIPIAAGVINFVVLTSAASACNSGMFSTSRILYSLSNHNQGPSNFAKLNKNHVPSNALWISTLVLSVGALLTKLIPEQAFGIVTTISAICFIWVWGVILVCHLRYKKTRSELQAKSKFKAPLTPFINYVVLILFVIILIIMLFAKATRFALLLTPLWFILLFTWYSYREKNIKLLA
ncbi:amino acid permease [Heyndrickxia sporothermodurans]|uniref:Amino acid permease n=1 Tax=Heyndrickxia sporothermodurans TaxID=46224 RepID=A0AB37HD81_9BACI|nr:amino acid permease [Heyndrickxia sporothermodurans]MBL5767478.1 amino acid permease [Heyndrickxia sporothermodurans]MBL5770943.1 amino acid permease [Heyndrickxia sporothermodurans]MBL5774614.1 amino acid permease [Heyndrickxia sporothermodurans]MBL5780035.1 amino acid permease [Heyndrickxia sporothermodurans]MBL5781740.1 amino acid permease [Heyndrickxia sporothermodurans]